MPDLIVNGDEFEELSYNFTHDGILLQALAGHGRRGWVQLRLTVAELTTYLDGLLGWQAANPPPPPELPEDVAQVQSGEVKLNCPLCRAEMRCTHWYEGKQCRFECLNCWAVVEAKHPMRSLPDVG